MYRISGLSALRPGITEGPYLYPPCSAPASLVRINPLLLVACVMPP